MWTTKPAAAAFAWLALAVGPRLFKNARVLAPVGRCVARALVSQIMTRRCISQAMRRRTNMRIRNTHRRRWLQTPCVFVFAGIVQMRRRLVAAIAVASAIA